MRIMSVDDSRATRQIIKTSVEILGFDFFEAANGLEALQLLEKENGNIDLIVLDWNMPVMSGIEFLEKIKTHPAYNHIPVTMVTTEIERSKVVEAISKGAQNYVMKPFSQEDLIGKIMESLGMGI